MNAGSSRDKVSLYSLEDTEPPGEEGTEPPREGDAEPQAKAVISQTGLDSHSEFYSSR